MDLKYNIFERGILAHYFMKETQNSYSDSSNPLGGKNVSYLFFRPLLYLHDTMNIFQIFFLHFFKFYLIQNLQRPKSKF